MGQLDDMAHVALTAMQCYPQAEGSTDAIISRTDSLVRLWLRIMVDVMKLMLVTAPCTAQPEDADAYAPLPEHEVQHT